MRPSRPERSRPRQRSPLSSSSRENTFVSGDRAQDGCERADTERRVGWDDDALP